MAFSTYRLSRRKWSAIIGIMLATGVTLAGCGSGSSPANVANSKKVVHLTFWSWVPGIKQQVALFNKTHRNIQVTLDKVVAGTSGTYSKMFTAIKAGDPPDVGQIEFDVLPQFVQTGGILNLANYGAAKYAKDFTPFTWGLVHFGGGIWAIPQATGPTGLLYNATLFKKYNLAVPKTWSQFAHEAISLHKAHPHVYLTNFDPSTSWLAMSVWQAGGRWFQIVNNKSWKLGFTSSPSQQVASYWQALINRGAVPIELSFNSSWYHQLANGTILTWPTAQWGTTIIQDEVSSGSGKWKIAPMPQWSAGASQYGQWGGSTTAVFKATKHPHAAETFALWMNKNQQSIAAGVKAGFGWPAAKSGVSVSPLHVKSPYFSNQNPFPIFNASETHTVSGWSYGPDYLTTVTQMRNLYSHLGPKGAKGGLTLLQILSKIQHEQLSTLKSQGISAIK